MTTSPSEGSGRLSYRPAEQTDLDQLAEMRWDMRVEGGEIPLIGQTEFLSCCRDWYQRTSRSDAQAHFVAADGDVVLATISVHRVEMVPRPCKPRDHFGCITNNYTRPANRGRGIASGLLGWTVDWASGNDLELLIVWPSEPAIPFYARSGFAWQNEVMELRLRDYVPIGKVQ